MTPQFEMVAEQERIDPRTPEDGVMAAHVMDNMHSLMYGSESKLTQPANTIPETPGIMPMDKFGLDQLKPNENPIPADHDCDRCVIDATACTLLQAANENSSFMDRLNVVAQLRKTVPDFMNLPNEVVDSLIKQGMEVVKIKRTEMQANPSNPAVSKEVFQKPTLEPSFSRPDSTINTETTEKIPQPNAEKPGQPEQPVMQPRVIMNRNHQVQNDMPDKALSIGPLPQIKIEEIKIELKHTETTQKESQTQKPPEKIIDVQEMRQAFYFQIQKDEPIPETIKPKIEHTEEKNVDTIRGTTIVEIQKTSEVLTDVDTHNVFTFTEKSVNTENIYDVVIQDERMEQLFENVQPAATIAADIKGVSEEILVPPPVESGEVPIQPTDSLEQEKPVFPVELEEPVSVDYIFKNTDVFVTTEELPVIQMEALTLPNTKIAQVPLTPPEPPSILENIQTDLQPLSDLEDGIISDIQLEPAIQMVYINNTSEDIPVSIPKEPENIISQVNILTENEPNENPSNDDLTETDSPEIYDPKEVTETIKNLEEMIDKSAETDPEERQVEWNNFVESNPVLNDVSEMLSRILLQLILINNPQMSEEIYSAKTVANSSLLYRYLSQKAAIEENQTNYKKRNPAPVTYSEILILLWSYANALTITVLPIG